MKKGYVEDIERATLDNEDFRRVVYTGKNLQLVLMISISSSASRKARGRSGSMAPRIG
jgi:hypothetical protein